MSYSVQNKVALVTGANRGIGKTIVESLINHGAKKVYLAVRDVNSTQDLEEKFGDKVITVQADVSDTASIQALAQQTMDIVVNNAGVTPQSVLGEDVEKILFSIRSKRFGLLRVANAFAKTLEAKGALVQMNSIASIKTFPTFRPTLPQSGVIFINTSIKNRPKGVTVLSVHPGQSQQLWQMPQVLKILPILQSFLKELLMHLKQVIFTYFQMKWQSKLKQLIKVSPIML
jgi:NAD(P)-dependent dehydrogenase (short-subunit alcohol dehydrogenase family)